MYVAKRLCGAGAAERRYPTSKVTSSSHVEIPHFHGKDQWLHFAGAAVKKYPTSKRKETPVRQYVLREGIRGPTD